MSIVRVPDTDSFDLWRQKTNLSSLQQGDLSRLIAGSLTFPIAGTVSSFGDSLVGTGTNFLVDLAIGSKVRALPGGAERTIVEITSATTAKTNTAFTPALASSQLVTVDIITALNSAYQAIVSSQRHVLVRAIGMS